MSRINKIGKKAIICIMRCDDIVIGVFTLEFYLTCFGSLVNLKQRRRSQLTPPSSLLFLPAVYFFTFRLAPARPIRPVPSKIRVVGSGTVGDINSALRQVPITLMPVKIEPILACPLSSAVMYELATSCVSNARDTAA